MIWLSFIWFSVLYGGTFYFSRNKDLFGPLKFTSAKMAVFNLPFILYTAIFPDTFLKKILSVCQVTVEDAFLKYTILQTLAFISLIAGVWLFEKILGKQTKTEVTTVQQVNKKRLIWFTGLVGLVAMGAYMVFLYRIGGLVYLLHHLDNRIGLQQGHYILELLELFPLIVLLLILLYRHTCQKAFIILTLASLVVFSVILTTFGARQPTMIVLGIAVVGYHYYVRKIVFNRKVLLMSFGALAFLVAYILVIPVLRLSDKQKLAIEKHNTSVYSGKAFMYNWSYVFIDVLVANYFTEDNAWYMQGYFEPVAAFNHKGDKGGIPQVDQGVYLKSIYLYQKDFRPPMPRKDVSKTSWPTENFGFAYANFLWIGLVIFFFLQGVVFSVVYKFLRYQRFNPVILLFYVQIMLQFNFSSLKIAFFLKTFPLFCICWLLFNKFVLSKNQGRVFE